MTYAAVKLLTSKTSSYSDAKWTCMRRHYMYSRDDSFRSTIWGNEFRARRKLVFLEHSYANQILLTTDQPRGLPCGNHLAHPSPSCWPGRNQWWLKNITAFITSTDQRECIIQSRTSGRTKHVTPSRRAPMTWTRDGTNLVTLMDIQCLNRFNETLN